MKRAIAKRRSLRLDRKLKLKILERDGWTCQCCGRRDQLQIHHLIHRSQSGADCEENLIVLCAGCHRAIHDKADALSSRQLHVSGVTEL